MLDRTHKQLLPLLACLFMLPQLRAVSGIANNQVAVEKMISSTPDLQHLDVELNQKYKELMQRSFNPTFLRSEQRQWLQFRRNQCRDVASIKSAYLSRLSKFNTWEQYSRVAGPSFAHFPFYDGQPPEVLLTDRFLGSEIKQAIGRYLQVLVTNLSTSGGIEVTREGDLIADGCAAHLCSIAEARIFAQRNGKVEIVLWDSGRAMYFTNEPGSDDPSLKMKEFVEHLGNPQLIPVTSH